MSKNNFSSHDSSDGKNLSERLEKYCEWEGCLSENIDFGGSKAVDIMIFMIVDDGVKDRTHRKNVFNADFQFIGIGANEHPNHKHVTVCDYSSEIRNLGDENPNIKTSVVNVLPTKNKQGKNNYQETDPDAPDNTKTIRITTVTKTVKGKSTNKVKKVYTLDDGSTKEIEMDL